MELSCTCGATPPADARFCHKCGRPLSEEDAAKLAALQEPAPTPVPPPLKPQVVQPVISFRNARAVAVSIGVAAATFVCIGVAGLIIPGIAPVAGPFLLSGAGFAAAVIYGRQSHQPLSGGSGARLGWMTGLWFFLAILIIATFLALVVSGPMRDEMTRQLQTHPQFAQVKIPTAADIAANVVQMFFFTVLFPIFGGIIGARFSSRNQPSA